jgi:hypothetical protein
MAMLELKPDKSTYADYEHDLVLWYERQVQLLRERRFDQLDLENLIEELEGTVKNHRRELVSRLQVVLMHLLKCQFQHQHILGSWLGTLVEQRSEIESLLEDSPSLGPTLMQVAEKAYPGAVRRAAAETGLPPATFPAENPYSREQLQGLDFLPPDTGN